MTDPNVTAANVTDDTRVTSTFAFGVGFGLLLHALQIPLFLILLINLDKRYGDFAAFGAFLLPLRIGLSQLIHLVPAIAWAASSNRPNAAKGLCLAGILTCFGNIGCHVVFTPPVSPP